MAATVALQPSSNINILTFYPKIIIYHRISAEKCIEMKRLIVRALMLQKSKNIIFQKPILPSCSSTQHFFNGNANIVMYHVIDGTYNYKK